TWSKISTRTLPLLLPLMVLVAGTSCVKACFIEPSLVKSAFVNPAFFSASVGGCLLAVAMLLLGALLSARSLPDACLPPSFSLQPAHASGSPSGPTFFLPERVCPRDPCGVAAVRGAWFRFLPRALQVVRAAAASRARR